MWLIIRSKINFAKNFMKNSIELNNLLIIHENFEFN